MEQKQIIYDGSVCGQLHPLSAKYPWFVAQNLGEEEEDSCRDLIFYNLHDPPTIHQCQIPQLLGRRIRGYFHGWVILSKYPQDVMWCIWNPDTSKMIDFPPWISKDGDFVSIDECCLSAPPDDPSSVLLLTSFRKPTLVFFRLNCKRKKLRWIEMSYASQLKKITGEDGIFLHDLSCCNGKVYAIYANSFGKLVFQLDILVREKEVIINLLLLCTTPFPPGNRSTDLRYYLKGYGTELFFIKVGFYEERPEGVHLFKLDMASIKKEEIERFKGLDMSCQRLSCRRWKEWEEWDESEEWDEWEECDDLKDLVMSANRWERLIDLKDAVFFLDLARDCLAYYRPAISSELGGYIHVRDKMDKIMYSYHVKDSTISLSSIPLVVQPTSRVSLWECRLGDDLGEAKCTVDFKQEEDQIVARSVRGNEIGLDEPDLLSLPFHMLEMIINHCVGVEYMNFRVTCKRCHQAAPLIKWRDESALRRLHAYSLISPWLMAVDQNQGVITFTDPMLGDTYFMNKLHVSLNHERILCSMFGWFVFRSGDFHCLVFFNPFTCDLRKLPETNHYFRTMCFSAPPTSPDCMVVGFSITDEHAVLIHYVAQEPTWRTVRVDVEIDSIRFPTFFGQDLYALGDNDELIGFKDLSVEDNSLTLIKSISPVTCCRSPRYYLIKCHRDLLIVIVGKFGERIEVFKRNGSKEEWEKIDNIGKYVIYICDTTCLSTEAKLPQMENKICFPLLYSKNKKMVFYSLETHMYHTFDGENIQQRFKDFSGTTCHLLPHAWIEPSWS